MPALPKIPAAWSHPLHVAIVAVVSLVGMGLAGAAYLTLKRDSDRSCPPPCTLEHDPKPATHREEVKTVGWPLYGYEQQRRGYLPTERVKPPYKASEWSFQAGRLLEFAPIVAKGTLYFQDKNALFY